MSRVAVEEHQGENVTLRIKKKSKGKIIVTSAIVVRVSANLLLFEPPGELVTMGPTHSALSPEGPGS